MAKRIKAKSGTVGGKTEGGSGGKLGHSNMTHWTGTAGVKAGSRKARRVQSQALVRQALKGE